MLTDKDKAGMMLIAGVLATVAAIFAIKGILDTKPKPDKDNCVEPVTSSTVLLLDETEAFSVQTGDEIRARALRWIRERVGVNERVTVFAVSDLSTGSLSPLFSKCRPPESGNRLTENTRRIHKRFDEGFLQPLQDRLSIVPGSSRTSPITQAITDITLTHYLRAQKNTLLIFSDMLENTASFSMYRCPTEPVKAFKEARRGAVERPQFRNTDVIVNVVPRLRQTRATECSRAFWPWFFGDNQGSSTGVTFDFLPGGGASPEPPSHREERPSPIEPGPGRVAEAHP